MLKKKSASILILIASILLSSNFQKVLSQTKVGTTAVSFLGISIGPRATAMGNAFVAMADDATSLYYNPAGIAQLGKSQVMLSRTNWLVDTELSWIGVIIKLDGANAIGVSLTHLDFNEEEVTTVLLPEGTGEKWGASDITASISYARNLSDKFSIGGNLKYIQERLWNETASAFAIDVGLLFTTGFNDMRLGVSISNFGSDMQLEGKDLLNRIDLDPDATGNNETIVSRLKTNSWPLPIFFRVGAAMDLIKGENLRFTVASDALRPSDNSEIVNLGGEIALNELLFLRGGYKSLFRDESEEGLTLGVGLNLMTGSSLDWRFDYTFVDFGLFEDIHMIALGVSF